jgi:hypothetical protein
MTNELSTLQTPMREAGLIRTGKAICQDITILSRVSRFSYNLNVEGFVAYFISRTGMRIDKCKCEWDYVVAVCANPSVPAPSADWALTRAKLQDCWEIWTA